MQKQMQSSVLFKNLMTGIPQHLEAVVEKRSSSNMFWNKRSITLIDGVLSYYSKVYLPGTDWKTVVPKSSVNVVNIVRMGPPEKQKKPNTLQITFLLKDRIKSKTPVQNMNVSTLSNQSQINNSTIQQSQQPVVITNKKDVCVWEFSFANQDQLKHFTTTVDEIRNPPPPPPKTNDEDELLRHKLEEERRLEKERLELERMLREKEHRERMKAEAELERQRIEKERELQERKEREKREAKEKAKLQDELQRQKELEQQRILRERQEFEKRQAMKQKLTCAWNYRFIQAIERAHMKKQTPTESVEASFLIHESIHTVKENAVKICKTIIDELVLPLEMKSYRQSQSVMEYFSKGQDDQTDDVYIAEGFFIKLAYTQIKQINIPDESRPKKLQIYDETLIKSLGNEFRCMSLLADLIEEKLQEDPFFPLRVPVTVLVDYKGVRAFALALPPTNTSTQVMGLQSNGQYLHNQAVFELLSQISSDLNLKIHRLTHEFTTIEIPLTLFAEVHQLAKEEYQELRWIENDNNQVDFPPQQLNLYILQKCADLMPIYVGDEVQYTQRLRPELLQTYNKQLSSDAFLVNNQDYDKDDQDVIEASMYLRENRVKKLVEKLESLESLPVDSQSLTDVFHRMGVNMRLLGLVCSNSQLPHVKQICTVEMVSRVCKKVLRNNISDLLRNFQKEYNSRVRNEKIQYLLIQDNDDISSKQKILALSNRLCLESVLDFLNLVLGIGQESDIFWKQILQKQVWFDYRFPVDVNLRKDTLPKGLLLQSLLTQFNFSYSFDDKTIQDIFEVTIPLKVTSQMEYQVGYHLYGLQKSRVGSILNDLVNFKNLHHKDMLVQSCTWALRLVELQQPSKAWQYLAEMAEYYYSIGDLTEAEKYANESLDKAKHVNKLNPQQILIKIALAMNQQDKAVNLFEKSLQQLELYLGESHPIHSILYCILGFHFMHNRHYEDAYTLYKSGLVSSQRVLGQSHPQTAQICTDLGTLLTKLNQRRESLQLFEQAMNIFQAVGMTSTLPYARNMLHLAALHFHLGSVNEAVEPVLEGVRIYEIYEFQNTNQLLESYVLSTKIFSKLQEWDQSLQFCDKIYGVLDRHQMLEDSTAILEFTLENILLGLLSQMTTSRREWLIEMIQEMHVGVQPQEQVKLYRQHLNQFIVTLNQNEQGSLVKLFHETTETILNNTERMLNNSDDMMDDDLKRYIQTFILISSVRLLENISYLIGSSVIQELVNQNYF